MTYNIVQMIDRVQQLLDRVKTARYTDQDFINSINEAINIIVKDRVAPIRIPHRYSVQSAQRIRDELYTLIPTPGTGTITNDLVPFPADYLTYLLLYATVDGTQRFARPISYNLEGDTKEDPFSKPTAETIYYNERATGLRMFKPSTSTFTTYELWYLKNPAVVSIGRERNKIAPDPSAISIGVTYYVWEDALHNGVTYEVGETFVAANTNLNSGYVIPSTNITNCDLPGNMHMEVCTLAAKLMSGQVEDWNKKQSLDMDVEKS